MLSLGQLGLGWAILAGRKTFRPHRRRPSGRQCRYRLRGEIDVAHSRVRASRAQGGQPARLTPAGLVLIVPHPGKRFLRMEKNAEAPRRAVRGVRPRHLRLRGRDENGAGVADWLKDWRLKRDR